MDTSSTHTKNALTGISNLDMQIDHTNQEIISLAVSLTTCHPSMFGYYQKQLSGWVQHLSELKKNQG